MVRLQVAEHIEGVVEDVSDRLSARVAVPLFYRCLAPSLVTGEKRLDLSGDLRSLFGSHRMGGVGIHHHGAVP